MAPSEQSWRRLLARAGCIASITTMMHIWVSCGPPLGQMYSNILYILGQWHKKTHSCSLPFKKNISVKKKMWKCRHSSENPILHSTEPLQRLLNDPFYLGAMSVPFWIVRPGKKNTCMYTSGWLMYYSCALCSFWQTDLIKGKKATHRDKLSPTGKSELAVSKASLLPHFKWWSVWIMSLSFLGWWY